MIVLEYGNGAWIKNEYGKEGGLVQVGGVMAYIHSQGSVWQSW